MSPGQATEKKPPEKKIGPFQGGVSVCVWLNNNETPDGRRQSRSISISPRRYRDQQTGDWKDAQGFRPSDLPALIFALTKAQEYVFTTPLPGQSPDDEAPEGDGTF